MEVSPKGLPWFFDLSSRKQERMDSAMCEANAYLRQGEEEVLFMESVDIIEPYADGLKLVDIFGRQKFIRAKVADMTLLDHRVYLEYLPAPEK